MLSKEETKRLTSLQEWYTIYSVSFKFLYYENCSGIEQNICRKTLDFTVASISHPGVESIITMALLTAFSKSITTLFPPKIKIDENLGVIK